MDFLFVIGLVFVLAYLVPRIAASAAKPTDGLHSNQIVVEKKECPPHQWFWQEVVDQHGNSQGTRIVCKVCGPMKSDLGT